MHVLVLRRRASHGRVTLVSSCMCEWRQVVHKGMTTLSLELPGVGAEASLPAGCLEMKLELLPAVAPESRPTEAEVMMDLKRERDAQVEAERKFFAYARAWWAQFLDLSPAHQQRPVKLFALSELGTQRPVSAFVRPLRADRILETPQLAAHFVSLLAHARDHAAGSSVADVWHTSHATLATAGGETEEHALLLCSLLLCFGLDAYVCIGTDGRGPHVWVMSLAKAAIDGAATFWESLSGEQFDAHAAGGHPYLTLACAFSHDAFYANIQPSTDLGATSLRVHDPSLWEGDGPSAPPPRDAAAGGAAAAAAALRPRDGRGLGRGRAAAPRRRLPHGLDWLARRRLG